jgi:hypothetical protein
MSAEDWDKISKKVEEIDGMLSRIKEKYYSKSDENVNASVLLEKKVEDLDKNCEQPKVDQKHLDFRPWIGNYTCFEPRNPLFEFLDDVLIYLIKKGYSFNRKKESVKSFVNKLGEAEELFANGVSDFVVKSGYLLIDGLKSSGDDLKTALSYLSEYTYYGTAYLNLGCELGLSSLKNAVINSPDNTRKAIRTYRSNQKFLSAPAYFGNENITKKSEIPVIQKFKNIFANIKSNYKSRQKFLNSSAYFASDKEHIC